MEVALLISRTEIEFFLLTETNTVRYRTARYTCPIKRVKILKTVNVESSQIGPRYMEKLDMNPLKDETLWSRKEE